MFSKNYAVLYRIATWVIGAIALGGGGWLLFPGAYKLGMWFGNSIMHWDVGDINAGPQGWMLGIALLFVPVLFWFVASMIGEWIISYFE